MVTSAASAAAAGRHAPVVLLGYGEGPRTRPNSVEKLTEFRAARPAAEVPRSAWPASGATRSTWPASATTPSTIGVLIGLEDACLLRGAGEGGAFVAGGGTAIGGAFAD